MATNEIYKWAVPDQFVPPESLLFEKGTEAFLAQKAPEYRKICPGLNLEGKCHNMACLAFNTYVVIPKGLGQFHIAEELDQCLCPACNTGIPLSQISTLSFWNCEFSLKGKQIAPQEQLIERRDIVKKSYYVTYQASGACVWAYLEIITKNSSEGDISKPSISREIANLAPCLPKGKSILLVCISVAGFGDLSCTMKFALALKTRGGIAENQIVIAMEGSLKDKISQFNYQQKKFTLVTFEDLQRDAPSVLKVHNVVLQIIIPAPSQYTLDNLSFLNSKIKTLLFYEYGSLMEPKSLNNSENFSLGLNEHEMGIFLIEELFEGFCKVDERCVLQEKALNLLSTGLKTAILGKMDGREFQQKSLLYFGYANDQRKSKTTTISEKFRLEFIKAILAMKKNQVDVLKKNLVFVIPGPSLSQVALEKLKLITKEKGFGKFAPTDLMSLKSELHDFSPSKTHILTVIVGKVLPTDFHQLLLASEPECMVTGDQSLGEAICANKRFIYQALDHKKELAASLNDKYKNPISFEYSLESTKLEAISNIFESSIPYTSINYEICTKLDCYPKIQAVIIKTLESF